MGQKDKELLEDALNVGTVQPQKVQQSSPLGGTHVPKMELNDVSKALQVLLSMVEECPDENYQQRLKQAVNQLRKTLGA